MGAVVVGTGRAADRDTALDLGVHAFLDLEADKLEDVGEADVVMDVIGGEILDRSAAPVRGGGTLVTTIKGCPRSDQRTGAPSSSLSKPTVPGSRTWPSGSGTDASSRSSVQCGRSPKRLLRSPRTSAPPAERSSGSSKAVSPLVQSSVT